MGRNFISYLLLLYITCLGQPIFASGYEDISLFQILMKLILYIGIFIIVIFATLYGTRLIAKNYKSYRSSKYIDLLDTLNISGGIKIIIMKVNKKIYILAVSSNGTEVVDIVNKDEFVDEDFDSYLDKYTGKNHNKSNLDINKIIEKLNFSKDKEDR